MKARIPSTDSAAYNSSVLQRFESIIKEFQDNAHDTKCAYGNTMYALDARSNCAYREYIQKFMHDDQDLDVYSKEDLQLYALAIYNALKVSLLLPYAFKASESEFVYYGSGEGSGSDLVKFVNILRTELVNSMLKCGLDTDFEKDLVFHCVTNDTGFYNHVMTTLMPFAYTDEITRHYFYMQIGVAAYCTYKLTLLGKMTTRVHNTLFAALAALDSLNPPTKLEDDQIAWARSCKMLECANSDVYDIIGKDGFKRITEASNSSNVWAFNKPYSDMTKRERAVLFLDGEGVTIPIKKVNEVVSSADHLYTATVSAFCSGVHSMIQSLAETLPIMRECRANNAAGMIANMFSTKFSNEDEVISLKRTIRKLEEQLKEAKTVKPKEIVRTEQIEVSDKRDKELIDSLRAKIARLEERIKSLNDDLESLDVIQQDNEDLMRRNEELDKLIEELTGLDESEQEVDDFTLEERAILSTLKVHIDMPDCASVKVIKSLMPCAKIDTDNLGAHGNVNLTPGYSIYCFCTKLSHSHFTSFSNQVNASGYVKCFANTCSAMSICKAILKTYKENNSHAD